MPRVQYKALANSLDPDQGLSCMFSTTGMFVQNRDKIKRPLSILFGNVHFLGARIEIQLSINR